MHNHYVVNKDEYIYIYVMYNVLSGLAACGRLGVAARASGVLFVTRHASTCATIVSRVSVVDGGGRV